MGVNIPADVKGGRAASSAHGLSMAKIAGYSAGNLGKNILANTLVYFLIFYATDLLGLAAEKAGLIVLIATIWGAILDPLVGLLADRTRSRLGKYGPFMLCGAPLASVSLVLIFALPVGSPHAGVMLLALLLAFKLFYALVDLPHNALMARISSDSRERSTIATTRFLFSSLGSLAIALGAFGMFCEGASGTQADRFLGFAAVAGFVSLAALWVSWLSVAREDRTAGYRLQKFSGQIHGLRALFRDREALILIFAGFLSGAAIPLFVRGLPYFCKYNLGDDGLVPVGIITLVLGQIVSVPLWRRLAVQIEKSKTLLLSHALGVIAHTAFYVSPSQAGLAYVIPIFLVGVAAGGIWSIIWAMAPDVVDKAEGECGVRSEAVIFSFASVAMKLGIAVGAWLFGFLLQAVGFQAGEMLEVQTLSGIKVIMAVLPALGSLGVIVCLLFYRLTHDHHGRIMRDRNKLTIARD